MTHHEAIQDNVLIVFDDGEQRVRAMCKQAAKAAAMLDKARILNDKRRYTDAARMIAACEALPGFYWINEDGTP